MMEKTANIANTANQDPNGSRIAQALSGDNLESVKIEIDYCRNLLLFASKKFLKATSDDERKKLEKAIAKIKTNLSNLNDKAFKLIEEDTKRHTISFDFPQSTKRFPDKGKPKPTMFQRFWNYFSCTSSTSAI